MMVCGIDPGLKGAFAVLHGEWPTAVLHAVHDMPLIELNRNEVDAAGLAARLGEYRIDYVFVERVQGMPDWGVANFRFGESLGIVKGVIGTMGLRRHFVTPQQWKKQLLVPREKDGARARAAQLIPNGAPAWRLIKHDGRAESALIGLWGLRWLAQQTSPLAGAA